MTSGSESIQWRLLFLAAGAHPDPGLRQRVLVMIEDLLQAKGPALTTRGIAAKLRRAARLPDGTPTLSPEEVRLAALFAAAVLSRKPDPSAAVVMPRHHAMPGLGIHVEADGKVRRKPPRRIDSGPGHAPFTSCLPTIAPSLCMRLAACAPLVVTEHEDGPYLEITVDDNLIHAFGHPTPETALTARLVHPLHLKAIDLKTGTGRLVLSGLTAETILRMDSHFSKKKRLEIEILLGNTKLHEVILRRNRKWEWTAFRRFAIDSSLPGFYGSTHLGPPPQPSVQDSRLIGQWLGHSAA